MNTRKRNSPKEKHWLPLADLMTVLMVMFLFISICYMFIIQKKQQDNQNIIIAFERTKKDLLADLKKEFKEEFKEDKWNAVIDDNTLSIRFRNEDVLFDFNKSSIKQEFKDILSDFFPRYLSIILKKKYKGQIAEVRVEGHTSTEGDYVYNLQLSQQRTRKVIAYLRSLPTYQQQSQANIQKLQYLLTANGLSYGRTLDANGTLTYVSKKEVDNSKCRRVEFRIVVSSEEVLNKLQKRSKK